MLEVQKTQVLEAFHERLVRYADMLFSKCFPHFFTHTVKVSERKP